MQTARHWVLPKDPTSPAEARGHIRSTGDGLPRDLFEIALLLTSELVTNAVRYGGPSIVLTVKDEPDVFRVEVHDDGPRAPRPQHGATTGNAVSGRGLLLVESLSHEWGTSRRNHETGKSVWFTLRKSL